eukprot:bmy_12050T0
MSVLTSPRGKVEVVHCRRTESQDIYCIKNLIRKFTQKLFGSLNIISLLEKANLAITLHNDQEEIMAQATFLDYPNWNVAPQDDWVSVFRELDSEIPCTPLNTLFMHLFVAVDEYSVGCCKEIIRTVFKAVPDLHFIFLIVPSYMSLGSTLITVFDQVGNIPSLTYDEDFAVHICHRHSHYPQLHIRKARGGAQNSLAKHDAGWNSGSDKSKRSRLGNGSRQVHKCKEMFEREGAHRNLFEFKNSICSRISFYRIDAGGQYCDNSVSFFSYICWGSRYLFTCI